MKAINVNLTCINDDGSEGPNLHFAIEGIIFTHCADSYFITESIAAELRRLWYEAGKTNKGNSHHEC